MEELKNILLEFSQTHLTENNGWFNWCVNENHLPKNIILPDGNNYSKNISLKKQLHTLWKNEKNETIKGDLIEYYIVKWGGIKTNGVASLNIYRSNNAEELILKGNQGVASWSKALVVHDWNNYAIFDARVSCSLNILQILSNNEAKILFPILSSRNNLIKKGNSEIKEISRIENWSRLSNRIFYEEYIKLLKSVAKELNSNISTIEMLLFAKAEVLVNELQNK
ncbi:hypothetical protein [Flavobacterium ammonificans]|uniref:hypothetical protein n=1 Tax=Flavobacterium ammonificans TaxID=1751056 RepID=UPI001E383520|nr:hypothetical protein [Flavobacterium ammonificans]BDB56459.1 hypothetical protein SHINM13_07550 [Flavobacterium ammonificans]